MLGFFEGDEKDYYNSYTQALLIDPDVYGAYEAAGPNSHLKPWPSVVHQSVASSVVGNSNIGRDLVGNVVNGMGTKINGLRQYGLLGENTGGIEGFARGLPKGKMLHLNGNNALIIKRVIEREIQQPIYLNSTLITQLSGGDIRYLAEYHLLDNKGAPITDNAIQWQYDEAAKQHGELNLEERSLDPVSPYYPVIPIREAEQRISDTDPNLTRTCKRAVQLLGLKFKDLDEMVHSPEMLKNKVVNAHVVVAADIASVVPSTRKYLFEYFKKLHYESRVSKGNFDYWFHHDFSADTSEANRPPPGGFITVSDGTYKSELAWLYSTIEMKTGQLEENGKKLLINQVITEENKQWNLALFKLLNKDLRGGKGAYVLKKQVTKNTYQQIVFYGLIQISHIGKKGKRIISEIEDAFTTDKETKDKNNFVVLVREDIAKRLGGVVKHDLMLDSVRMVTTTLKTVRGTWIQTDKFKVVMAVAAVAVTVLTAGAGTPLMSAAMAALVVKTVVVAVAMQLVMPRIMVLVEDEFGAEFAIYLAVVITLATGDLSNPTTYVNAATTYKSGMTRIETENALEQINKELELIQDEIEVLNLEEAQMIEDLNFTRDLLDKSSFTSRTPEVFAQKSKIAHTSAVDLPTLTKHYVESMQFTDRPRSQIKLDLRSGKAI